MTCNVIATGSQGNAVVLDGTILLDCGVPFGALEEVCQNLSLVVLTHIHGDHFRPETIKRLAFLRPALRFLCPPWLHQPLSSLGIYERVIDVASTAYRLSYGRLGGTWRDIQFEMQPIPHDVPNCAWHTQALLRAACEETGIPYELALAVIRQETEFRNVVGDDGRSVGYMQVQRRWHEDRMARLSVTDLMDPYGNFRVGCDYLAELLGKYPLEEALTAYNSGKPGKSAYGTYQKTTQRDGAHR